LKNQRLVYEQPVAFWTVLAASLRRKLVSAAYADLSYRDELSVRHAVMNFKELFFAGFFLFDTLQFACQSLSPPSRF
jgi:hypothetical protein